MSKKSSVSKTNMMKPQPSQQSMPDMPKQAPLGLDPEEMGEHSDYDITGGLDTLMKAHKISKDSNLMGKIQKHAKATKQAMGKIASMPNDNDGDEISSMDDFKKMRKSKEVNPVGEE